jgi:hypothetical protein
MGERVVLDRAGAVAQRVELGQPATAAGVARRNCRKAERALQARVVSASCAFSLKCAEVATSFMARPLLAFADRRSVGHAGEHLGDVARFDG